ncbi:hypothetical protein FNB79_14015 [Formosa sediminum]|uniref:Lipoprotein n=1 Tax=Formosa sediminum TaxID=2594004 RepID=A0A516GU53_9FLAO|nr:hypothetical protein [Formosa sediminum]QDO95038.1 hypothetical protein FNB79_14015 [Formosa sediminum]
MFKNLTKSILQIFISLLILILFSCDGQDKLHKKPQQILEENGLLESFSERIIYNPETYTETVTDTLLHSGYQVHIKTYLAMNSNIIKSEIKDSLNIKTFYRNALAEVSVSLKKTTIFNQIVSKTFIGKNIKGAEETLQGYRLNSIWIDDGNFAVQDAILLRILYCKPDQVTDTKSYLLKIFETGNYKITELKN